MAPKEIQHIVAYPRKEGGTFDMEYYLTTHMPMVNRLWKHHGIKSWSVVQYGPEDIYTVACVMEWESSEARMKAMADPATKEIMEDIRNFSNVTPVICSGEVMARG